jgi:NAD(P)-dependent dehydrogenase (short-subunit alcohol dehydrogenase family)
MIPPTHNRHHATATRDELLQEFGGPVAKGAGGNGNATLAAPASPRIVLVSQDVAAGEEPLVAALSPAIAELGGRVDVSARLRALAWVCDGIDEIPMASVIFFPLLPSLLSPLSLYVSQVLINCAGTSVSGAFDEVVEEAFEDMYRVNVLGSVFPTRAVLPLMKRQRSGAIVFVSSQAGQVGLWGYTAYSASKFALRGLAQALQMEVHPFNIFVSVAYPPDTDTPGFQVEELSKPAETSLICGVGNVFPAERVRNARPRQARQTQARRGARAGSVMLLSRPAPVTYRRTLSP